MPAEAHVLDPDHGVFKRFGEYGHVAALDGGNSALFLASACFVVGYRTFLARLASIGTTAGIAEVVLQSGGEDTR